MTSVITSLFTSKQTTIAGYVEVMRRAEASLMAYARQFAPAPHRADEDFSMQLMDTPIPRSVLPLKNRSEACQWMSCENNDENLIIHSIKVTSKENEDKNVTNQDSPPIVLLHGYMNGALYFYRNLLGLASLTSKVSSAVHALDLLGWGLSSRPKFALTDDTTETAEAFFVESLEAWRKYHNIPKMILGGHSMGGYISIAYAEKYPSRVDRLILLSPAGVPKGDEKEFEERRKQFPWSTRLFISTVGMMWNFGITPSGFLRFLPSGRGRSAVSGYIERRLPTITDPEEREQLIDYLYTNSILPGSGEDCLNRFLKPMAFAKYPAVDRIPNLKVKNISFIYGQIDWMNPDGGLEAQRLCAEKHSRDEDAPNVDVLGVKNAGHLLMLENWQEFNSAVALSAGCKIPVDAPKPMFFNVNTNNNGKSFFAKPRFQKERDYEAEKSENTVTPSPAMD